MIEDLKKLNDAILKQNHELGCPTKKEWQELVKLTVRQVADVQVQQLPTIGEAESIKTCKQGRTYGLYELTNRVHRGGGRYTGSGETLITKDIKLTSPEEMRLTAANIVKHPKATPKQKVVAEEFITIYADVNSGNIAQWAIDCKEALSGEYGDYQSYCTMIRSIARVLNK